MRGRTDHQQHQHHEHPGVVHHQHLGGADDDVHVVLVLDVHGPHAEIDMNGKRLRAALRDLRVIGGAPSSAKLKVNIDLQPRTGSLSELNVIGCTVDEALSRLEKLLDESTVTDQQVLRIIHGHGTGQLRRAVAEFLKEHPLVARFQTAKMDQGGGGVTVVELKD